MSTNKGFLKQLAVPVAMFMAVLVPIQPVVAAVAVGQTASADASVDGIRVPSGTTLISPAVVETGDDPAVLHLSNGEVVAVAPQSTAVVASVENGIHLAVEHGKVAYTNNEGDMETLSTTETILIAQQGQVQEGERIVPAGSEGKERICQLQNFSSAHWQTCRFDKPKDDSCNWALVEVPMSEASQHTNRDSVLACKDRNDLSLDCNCEKHGGAFAWWIPVVAVAGGIVLYEVINDDDDEPASPTTP